MNRFNLILKLVRITFNLCVAVFFGITILLLHGPFLQPAAAQSEYPSGASETDTVYVAPPTGEQETDRASILAALEVVKPGGTVQFAPGTYLVGEIIHVTVPRITLLGHPEGTILRGCNPSDFPESPDGLAELFVAVVKCNGLDMVGGYQSVLNFTFEYAWHALVLGGMECLEGRGCVPVLEPIESRPGGYLIQGNTFRNSANGVRTIGEWSEPAVIRENQFINTFHAAVIHGSTVHFLDNNIMVPEPEQVPSARHPGEALSLSATDLNSELTLRCTGNVIAGNRIEGHSDGISISLFRPGTSCRENVIQDNLIRVAQVRVPSSWAAVSLTDADSSVVGVPLALVGSSEAYNDLPSSLGETNQESRLEGNLIKGNHIQGAKGLGIELYRASGNQIVNNIIADIKQRAPYPGLTVNSTNPERAGWREANGSAIWLSPGSNGNEIMGNVFEDIASYAVFLEGDSNRVMMHNFEDKVRDLGSGNQISKIEVSPDTLRYVALADGEVVGEWLTWQESPDTLGYKINRMYYFPRTERLVLDDDGIPIRMDVEGEYGDGLRWYEIYKLEDGTARWYTPRERGVSEISGPAYYAAVHPGHDLGVLARALLRQESATLPLLPEGEARLVELGDRSIEADGDSRTVRLYAIHGIDLFPRYVWLAEDGSTFAGEWSILAGWEAIFPELRAATDDALADYRQALARELVPPVQTSPLVIRGARLFDSKTGMVYEGTTIVIEDGRITAVGPDNNVQFSNESELIEADGRMVLPGLWDMHAHLSFPGGEDPIWGRGFAPLNLAAGVTTVRDLGSHIPSLIALREAVETERAVGPRILAAGYMDSAESVARWAGVRVGSAEEVQAEVDRFAELGFVQIKIYNEMPANLVHVAVERAKKHGLRVSGHVPFVMTASEAVEAGFDEIQHMQMTFAAMLRGSGDEELFAPGDNWESWVTSYQVYAELTPESDIARNFIALLRDREVAIDPTMGYFISDSAPPGFIADAVDRLPGPVHRRLNHSSFSDYYVPINPLSRPAWHKTVDNMFGFIVAAHRVGVPILVGTDTWAGFGLHHEMELYVKAGIPAPEVLTLATLGAARTMNMDDKFGSIEPGKLADLILVDGDPTKNISDIRRVMTVIKDGRVYDPAAIYLALGIEPCCEN